MTGPGKHLVNSEIATAVRHWQAALRAVDTAVGERYGLADVERRCLERLLEHDATASDVARAVQLSPAAVTALLDRLEERGFIVRRRHPTDRRKLTIAATAKALELALEVHRPLAAAEAAAVDSFGAAELWSVIRFLDASSRLRRDFAASLQQSPEPRS